MALYSKWLVRSVFFSFLVAAIADFEECPSDGTGAAHCQLRKDEVMASLIAEDAVSGLEQQDNSLLQHLAGGKESSAIALTSSGDRTKAMAFEGGGFLSVADFAGVVAGALHALPQDDSRKSGIERLFEKFGTLTSISGGTWFIAQLVYSKKFQLLMEASAKLPWLAEEMWNLQYYAQVLNPLVGTSLGGTVSGLAQCVWKLKNLALLQQEDPAAAMLQMKEEGLSIPIPYAVEILAEVSILIQAGGLSWQDLVEQMLQRASGISATKPLGTKFANNWAKGKLYVIGSTAVTPPGDADFSGLSPNSSLDNLVLFAKHSGTQNFSYTSAFPKEPVGHNPILLPVKFSTIVGAGEDQHAPLPFCATADCFGVTQTYQGTVQGGHSFEQTIKLSDVYSSAFEQSGGQVPVASAAAASSAFKGLDVLIRSKSGLSQLSEKQGCVSLATWTTNKKHGKSFQEGLAMRESMFNWDSVTQPAAKSMAEAGLSPLVDGGATDYTGLGHALAQNATEILTTLDTGKHSMGFDASFLLQFEGGGGNPERVIFTTPTANEMKAAYEGISRKPSIANFSRIPGIEGSQFLESIAYGSVECYTKSNRWFGITGGNKVTLNVLAVVSKNITIGEPATNVSFNSFFNFGKLTGEIQRTMAKKENQADVTQILDYFL